MSESQGGGVVSALGESALTGWRGAASRAVSRPLSRRTPWTEGQIRTVFGLLILAYALYRVVAPSIRAVRGAS